MNTPRTSKLCFYRGCKFVVWERMFSCFVYSICHPRQCPIDSNDLFWLRKYHYRYCGWKMSVRRSPPVWYPDQCSFATQSSSQHHWSQNLGLRTKTRVWPGRTTPLGTHRSHTRSHNVTSVASAFRSGKTSTNQCLDVFFVNSLLYPYYEWARAAFYVIMIRAVAAGSEPRRKCTTPAKLCYVSSKTEMVVACYARGSIAASHRTRIMTCACNGEDRKNSRRVDWFWGRTINSTGDWTRK